MDLAKLYRLRSAHESLREAFKSSSQRARDAAATVAKLRQQAASDPRSEAAATLLRLPTADLARIPVEDLAAKGIDVRVVRQIIAAQEHATELATHVAAASIEVRKSGALLARLNAYAHTSEVTE